MMVLAFPSSSLQRQKQVCPAIFETAAAPTRFLCSPLAFGSHHSSYRHLDLRFHLVLAPQSLLSFPLGVCPGETPIRLAMSSLVFPLSGVLLASSCSARLGRASQDAEHRSSSFSSPGWYLCLCAICEVSEVKCVTSCCC